MRGLAARAAVGAVLLTAALAAASARPLEGALRFARPPSADSALVVPFVPQDELLCGGAAAAMVLRYHGERGMGAESFAHLVRPAEGGIRTDELAAELRGRGWRAEESAGDLRALMGALAAGLPPIVLIEVAPARWHYVVVVRVSDDAVHVHDPARAPDLRITRAEFVARWEGGRRWMLLVHARPDAADATPTPASGVGSPELARASAHFRAREWAAAATAAEHAVRVDPSDSVAWRLLGTSRYLASEPEAALDAWIRVGGARIDGARVSGLDRTRHTVVHALLGLAPGASLDRAALARARRRIALLPSASLTRVGYRALPDGWVEVEASVVEGPPHPFSVAGLARVAGDAAGGEGRAWASGLLGAGERLDLRWRPEEAGHSLALELAVPSAPGLAGRTEVGVARVARSTTDRTSAWLRTTDWATPWLRWEAGARVDRADGLRPGATAALELATPGDGASVRGATAVWPSVGSGLGDGGGYALLALDAVLARGGTSDAWAASLRAGARALRGAAPDDLMPGVTPGVDATGAAMLAGPFMGPDPLPLLRAHARGHGSSVVHGGAEATRWLGTTARVGLAGFVAGAWMRGDAGARDALVDAGVGLRLAIPGLPTALRLDRAWSLSDGAGRWSAGLSFAPGASLRP